LKRWNDTTAQHIVDEPIVEAGKRSIRRKDENGGKLEASSDETSNIDRLKAEES
jgi:hypothetical protein